MTLQSICKVGGLRHGKQRGEGGGERRGIGGMGHGRQRGEEYESYVGMKEGEGL